MAFKRKDGKKVSSQNHDRADDLLGTVVPLRAYDPAHPPSPEADLSNVIPFARRQRKGAESNTPAVEIAIADRPAPFLLSPERQRQIALLIGASLLVHGAIFAAFNREPEPHASIGMISISAEIVLGSQTEAGRSKTPTETSVDSPSSPTTDQEPDDTQTEKAKKNLTKERVEEPKEETKPEKAETAIAKVEEAPPVEKPPVPTDQAELTVQTKPAEKPKLTAEEKKPVAKVLKKIHEAMRHSKDDGENKRERSAPSSSASLSSNSIGRGRSDLDTNYRGIVAAHLARYKQFPAEARSRGDQGTATVSFSLSGSGGVTSVRLVRGSGVSSIDREATAMVRRASPFPPPPSGRAQSFTVPVNFHLR
jgi:protein TonB